MTILYNLRNYTFLSTAMSYIKNKPLDVYINPSDTFNSKNDTEAYIHQQLLNEFSDEILASLLPVENVDYGRDYYTLSASRGKNYLITGSRGSGKSTFLRNLVTKLESPAKQNGDKPCKLLCWYDPSASCGDDNYFFLNVVAALKSELESSQRMQDSSRPRFDFERAACLSLMQRLDLGIARLSRGKAPLSDLSEHNASMLRRDSPDMDEEIRRIYAKIVDKLCDINQIKAYIIAVDDADTNAAQCSKVLENLRLYISHPRVIVLVTGDKSINIERVREKYFSEFNSQYHQQDENGKEFRMKSVISHAGQYLMKLFPISHQRELCDLLTLARKRIPITVYLRMPDGNTVAILELEKIINKAFYYAISHNPVEIKPYTDLFMRLPLRSILQIIHFWHKKGVLEILKKEIETEEKNQEKEPITTEDRIQTEYVVRISLEHVLKDELSAAYYEFDNLNTDEGKIFYATMLKHCQKMDDLEHGYFLSGDMGITSEDKFLTMLLAVSFKERVKDLRGFISYLLFGPATVALYAKALEQYTGSTIDRTLKTLSDLRKKFESYLHVGSWHSASRWARHANMIWCADTGLEGLHSGILRLRYGKIIKKINSEILEKTFPKKGNPPEADIRQGIALLVCMSRSHERDNSYFISVFSYLAFIHRCLQACQNHAQAKNENEKAKKKQAAIQSIIEIIESYFPIKTCGKPEWQIDRIPVKTYNTESISLWEEKEPSKTTMPNQYREGIGEIAEQIWNWHRKEVFEWEKNIDSKGVWDLSPQVMGEIWANFYYALRRISHTMKVVELTDNSKGNSGTTSQSEGEHNTKQKAERVVADKELLDKFKETISYFRHHFCIPCVQPPEKSEVKHRMSDVFLGLIGSFPLTKSLEDAVAVLCDEDKQEENSNKQGSSPAQL